MEQQQPQARGRSPSATSTGGGNVHQQPHIKNSHSPPPAHFPNPNEPGSSLGIGLGLVDPAQQAQQQQFPAGTHSDYIAYNTNTNNFLNNQQSAPPSFAPSSLAEPTAPFALNQGFTDQLKAEDPSSFGAQTETFQQNNLLAPSFGDADFTIFPPTPGEPQFGAPLFVTDNRDNGMMAQANHSPTPPHLLGPDAHQPGSANHSPSFNQHQFSSPPGRHSRNVSLGPEAALLPRQIDWGQSGPQFQGHRRSPSEFSEISSAAPSPHLGSSDAFEPIDQSHSPLHRPQDAGAGLYQELHGISNFSISDHGAHSPNLNGGRSPSHSPAISPRILPQQLPEVNQQGGYLNNNYGAGPYLQHPQEAFPQLPQETQDMQGNMPAPPSINIDFAPTAIRSGFEPKSVDMDSLTPPDRGKLRPLYLSKKT